MDRLEFLLKFYDAGGIVAKKEILELIAKLPSNIQYNVKKYFMEKYVHTL